MLEKRVKVIFKVLEDTKADLVGFEKQHESTKLTKKNKKLNIIGRLSLPKKKKNLFEVPRELTEPTKTKQKIEHAKKWNIIITKAIILS